jgi:Na+/H+-translocating membrane pyrophosphatase
MLLGIAFGPTIIAGFLPGAIVSGVQLAISAANTGGAWDNAKKYIEGGYMIDDEGKHLSYFRSCRQERLRHSQSRGSG